MGGRGGLMIDLNQQGDASGEFYSAQSVPESMQASQSVSLSSPGTQVSPDISNSGPDAMQIAIVYRLRTHHVGAVAEFVGEAGTPLKNGSLVNCTCCGKPETRKKTVICDVCGQSFHLRCLKLRENLVSALDEWVCTTCTTVQGKKNWPLGRINVKEESNLALEGSNGSLFAGQAVEVAASGGLGLSAQLPHGAMKRSLESSAMADSGLPSGSSEKENFKRQKKEKDEDLEMDVTLSGKLPGPNTSDEPKTRATRLKTLCRAKDDILPDAQLSGRADVMESVSTGEKNFSFTSASASSKEMEDDVTTSSKDTELEKLSQDHMQKLKEFISQQGGTLDGDWTINVKKRTHSERAIDVTYFSPDKQKFRSKPEVARFLGVLENSREDTNVREISSSVGRGRKRDVPQEPQPVPPVLRFVDAEAERAKLESPRPPPPSGWPICEKVTASFVGDLLQIWEFLCRFADILGQKEPPSLEELEEIVADSSQTDVDRSQNKKVMPLTSETADQDGGLLQNDANNTVKHASLTFQNQELWGARRFPKSKPFSSSGCCSAALAESNIALLKIALSDLQQMVSGGGSDLGLEPKRGKKKEGEAAGSTKKQSATFMPLNDLTWPEVARRYAIGLLTLSTCGENLEISVQERRKILRCIQGDGGVSCGALDGVAAIEADALLLATAEKQLCRWLPGAGDKSNAEPEAKAGSVGKLPEAAPPEGTSRKPAWAMVLEPVRKLATNVGARIRNCIREALDLNPPDWARETLEWSISKDVYKGNASGPTKRAVLSVLEKVADEKYISPPKVEKKVEYVVASPALVMKRCRIILRELIASDDVRVFCNSLGGTVLGYFENEDDDIEVPLPLVARPLDFRMIDSRLAAGSYGDLHESYAADMRQLFLNVPSIFHDREDLIKVGQELSQRFESLYEEKVIKLVSGKEEVVGKEINQVDVTTSNPSQIRVLSSSSSSPQVLHTPSLSPSSEPVKPSSTQLDGELKKAPWEEGVCKICGIDKDDDSTLLCDGCDAEYHIYCLEPPLSMIPEGNWYCPACVAREQGGSSSCASVVEPSRTIFRQFNRARLSEDGSMLSSLVRSMDQKDYWHLTGSERVQLLKFLCDKVLESSFIRDHIDQSMEALPELQQKLRVLMIEQQASAVKGSHIADEALAADNLEAVNKETLPKKRGRKSTRFSTPSLDECFVNQNGIELFKAPVESSFGLELDSTVSIVDGKMIERLFQGDSESADAMNHMFGDSHNGLGHFFDGSQINSRAEDCQNGAIHTESLVRDNCVQSMPGNGETEAHPSHFTIPVSQSVESAAYELKGNSGVSQGLKLETPTDKSLVPGIPSDMHCASVIEASPLASVQATPAELIKAEIEKVEGELMKMAPRRECLGRDDLGRTYWALGWGGKYPWVMAEKISAADSNSGTALCNRVKLTDQTGIQQWSGYSDDDCMEQLLKWLKPTIVTERLLKSALAKWCLLWSSKYKKEPDKQRLAKSKYVAPVSVNTKAATILSKKFGSINQSEGHGNEPSGKRGRKKKSLVDGKIYRCDCLELVWTTRIHCPFCHHTYDTIAELEGHNNGTCSWRGFEDESQALILAKAKKAKNKGQDFQPLDLSVVIKRFTVHTMNRTRILEIGCLADKGLPRFVPAPPFSPLFDPSLHITGSQANDGAARLKINGTTVVHASDGGIPEEHISTDSHDQDNNVSGSKFPEETLVAKRTNSLMTLLPPSQPLLCIKQDMWALKKLKTSLLDIESLLSTDILEPSRSEPNRRRAWRSFVKSAASILELVQSLTLLEQMIKASCLKESWCNWTWLSAGFGIQTLCSLALRVYSLDSAIKYKKSSVDPDTDDTEKPNKPGRKKKNSVQV